MRFLIVIVLILFGSLAFAGEYQKDDFAYGYFVEVDGGGSVYSLPIPPDVYLNSVQKNLADVQVFNGQGEAVPHEIHFAEVQGAHLKTTVNVPLFPLAVDVVKNGEEISVEIKRDASGNILSIRNRNETEVVPAAVYLLDMEKAGSYPLELHLEFISERKGVMVPVLLEGSDDLIVWRTVARATLADLEFMGSRLHHDKISILKESGRYLRLVPGGRGRIVQITSVAAVSAPQAGKMKRSWRSMPLEKHLLGGRVFLEAAIGGEFPVDSLQLKFFQSNSILQAQVQSRGEDDESWRNRGTKVFYSLREDDLELQNEPFLVSRSDDTRYRLEVIQDGIGLNGKLPHLMAGYVPHRLVFVARGEGPFLLAFGKGNMVDVRPGPVSSTLRGLTDTQNNSLIRTAVLKKRVVLGGEGLLVKKSSRPWKKILLWGVLVVGVCILGYMVWSLSRKMNKTGAGID